MLAVYKYPLDKDFINLPIGFKILHVGKQNEDLFAWALINPKETEFTTALRVVGTGRIIDTESDVEGKFWGTYLLYNDSLVLHVWEIPQN